MKEAGFTVYMWQLNFLIEMNGFILRCKCATSAQ